MNISALLASALDELLEKIRPIMVVIRDGWQGTGAGVLAGNGLVLTNAHVARRDHGLRVLLHDGKEFDSRLIARDTNIDLALLQIPSSGYPTAVFAAKAPRPGELVYAFGHPWGHRNVLTGGVLSAVTSARTPAGELPLLRSDLQLAPGNSGGPLLNAAGEVIGLNAMILGGDQSIAIPAGVIRTFLERSRSGNEGML